MSKTLLFFVKVFSKRSHAEDFLRGTLHSNRLAFFRRLEEDEQANRGDRHEAVVGWYQPDTISLTINGREITDLAGPVSFQRPEHDDLNVFCIYAAHNGPFEAITDENVMDFKDHLSIPSDCLKLGRYAVVVTKVKPFLDRVVSAVKREGFWLKAGLVEYYDPDVFSGKFTEDEAVFRKRKEFEHQREYRFAFDTGIPGTDPLRLNIGEISDIAMLCDTSEINENLEVQVSGRDSISGS